MSIEELELAILSGDRYRMRQALMDILDNGSMDEFVDWVNRTDQEILKIVAPELRIIEMPDGQMYLELLPDVSN